MDLLTSMFIFRSWFCFFLQIFITQCCLSY